MLYLSPGYDGTTLEGDRQHFTKDTHIETKISLKSIESKKK